MAGKRREYIFTHHLRERFVQRSDKKFQHLQSCQEEDCPMCRDMKAEIKAQLEIRRPIDRELARRIGEAEENRSYLNNSGFMAWYYEKYGFDKKFEFLVHEDMLFVVIVDKGKKVVVTCVKARSHLAGRGTFRPKYNQVKTKEEKREERLLNKAARMEEEKSLLQDD